MRWKSFNLQNLNFHSLLQGEATTANNTRPTLRRHLYGHTDTKMIMSGSSYDKVGLILVTTYAVIGETASIQIHLNVYLIESEKLAALV